MVLIAALFSFSPARAGGGFHLALIAVGAGFGLYLLSEVATALGESGAVPAALAAWTPALVAAAIAISGLLHMEDG
jgi:lipopolysaccharide export system permease protein